MENLISLWSRMNGLRRAMVIGATAAVFLAILAMSRLASEPDMALLYAGLDSAAAGEVMAALDQKGVTHEVRGDSLLVPKGARDALRMELAAEGLPQTGPQGYEILEDLSGFSTTSQMFDAAFRRAREGELARTILGSPGVRAARVHIATTQDQPFRDEPRPTASVTVTRNAGIVTAAEAQAFRHLIAASVGGMRPEDVAVIDAMAGLIGAGGTAEETGAEARAMALKENAERLLAARVGPGRAIVEVSLDLVSEREQITERRLDPQGRVAISSDTSEKSGRSSDGGNAVTVASNLPEGDAASGEASQSQNAETRERVNYEVSETQRELVRVPGDIRRMTVAVLVDSLHPAEAGDGAPTERPAAELADLRDLVASAVGLNEARGDVLTLKSMAFEPLATDGALAEAGSGAATPFDLSALVPMGLFALVALGLGLFVLRPALMGRKPAPPVAPLTLPPAAAAAIDTTATPRVVTGEIDDIGEFSDLPRVAVDAVAVPDDPVDRLRRLIEQRQGESMEILRGWLNTEEERA